MVEITQMCSYQSNALFLLVVKILLEFLHAVLLYGRNIHFPMSHQYNNHGTLQILFLQFLHQYLLLLDKTMMDKLKVYSSVSSYPTIMSPMPKLSSPLQSLVNTSQLLELKPQEPAT